ncbi:hypothetical protein KBB49_03750, partial [Candidatus Saccharibacteria bacterium]|nr:hypothetical protein [Candidatus Saccharibacteria bacterium]
MLNLKKITRKTSRIFASLVLMTAQMTPFFVFSGAKASALDTGFKVPTSTHTPNDWDVNTVANVQTSNDVPVVLYASDNDGQEQGYSNFNFPAIPANSTIDGVEVVVEAKSTDSGNDCQVRVNLSWNNGTNYTTAIDATIDDTEGVDTLGGSNNNWGRTWSVGDFTNANFVLKIQDRDPGNQCTDDATTSVDQIQAKVYYTEPVPKPDLTIVKTNNVGNNVVVNGT